VFLNLGRIACYRGMRTIYRFQMRRFATIALPGAHVVTNASTLATAASGRYYDTPSQRKNVRRRESKPSP